MRSLLVVDDEASLRRVVQFLLQRAGYRVYCAESGEQALEVLGGTAVDMVLTDLRMPGMSGLDLTRAIRCKYPQIQVAIVTAFGSRDSFDEARAAGAHQLLMKPLEGENLVRAVRELVPPSGPVTHGP